MKVGSLFTGYGGLDLAVNLVFEDAVTTWVSDIEPGPKKIIETRFPGVPNLGDITTIDWETVADVDVIVGGSPCQDLSHAGLRAGMKPGTRSGLWESMTHAINHLKPRLVVWENVLGALSASAYSRSDVEPGTGPMGNESGGPVLRALGRVLGDLTNLGYDAEWATVRAADVGAPHGRRRVFVIAYPSGAGLEGFGHGGELAAEHAGLGGSVRLLPTPVSTDEFVSAQSDGERGFSTPLRAINKLLPTPKAGDADFGLPRTSGRPPEKSTHLATRVAYDLDQVLSPTFCMGGTDWGDYAPAIARWESVTGRPAPAPTQPRKTGKPQLSPRFVEWMMGLPEGWVTDTGISRALQLKALGNGVVPQQGAHAIQQLTRTQTMKEAA